MPQWRHHPLDFPEIQDKSTRVSNISFWHRRAEIHSIGKLTENYEEKRYCVTVTLTFDQRSPISIGSEPVVKAAILLKLRRSKSMHPFSWNLITDRQDTDKLQRKYHSFTILWRCKNNPPTLNWDSNYHFESKNMNTIIEKFTMDSQYMYQR